MAQQTPWWWQYYQGQGQQPSPTGTPTVTVRNGVVYDDQGKRIEGATSSSQTSQGQPGHEAPGPTVPPDYSGGAVDLPPVNPSSTPSTAPDLPPGLGGPGSYPSSSPFPTPPTYYNVPPNETSNFYSDTYQGGGPNPPPTENNIPTGGDQYLYNPPTNEDMAPPQSQSYYGGGFNPTPNEAMTAAPYDRYLYDNPPTNETSLPNNTPTYYGGGENPAPAEGMTWTPADVYQYDPNPPPNEDMLANPIDTGPNQDTNRYVPAGDGGNYIYDENWQPGGYQPPPDQSTEPPTPPGVTPDALPAGQAPPIPVGAGNLVPPPGFPPLPGSWNSPTNYANLGNIAGNIGGSISNAIFNPDVGYYNPSYLASQGYTPGGSFPGSYGGGTGSMWPGEGFAGAGGGPLPGSFAGLGSGGGGNLGGWQPFRNLWYGNQPYSPSNFANLTGWENSQGNALAGAQFYPGQTPGPIVYGPTAGGSYSNYLSTWNSVNSPSTTGEADPWGSFGHASHSGITSAQ